ncbi:hypothetical protein [Microbacterium sp. A84]|uniref:hypothetical protein n=1 Tax=Microbacterium sp. A84 TaxID=3450715 RepID=UPI003F42FD55
MSEGEVADAELHLRWPVEGNPPVGDMPWTWMAHSSVCNAENFLYGGWMLGALTRAAEAATSGTLRELTVGYPDAVALGESLKLTAEPILGRGRFRHVRISAIGVRGMAAVAQAVTGPPLEPGRRDPARVAGKPEDWPEKAFGSSVGFGTSRLVRSRPVRLENGADPSIVLQWMRVAVPVDPVIAVAVVSDAVPSAVRRVMPQFPFVPTMTAHLVMHAASSSDWMLVETKVGPVDSTTASGRVRLWSTEGVLLATANQTCRLLARPPGTPRQVDEMEVAS